MDDGVAPRAWLLMAAGDNRGHGGNSGYDDQIDAYYSWDSKVPNHKNLKVGDPIALWDKERLLGVSVIEEIETAPGVKTHERCPRCTARSYFQRHRGSQTLSRAASTLDRQPQRGEPAQRHGGRRPHRWAVAVP